MLCTSGFIDDVKIALQPRQLNVAAQLMEAQPTCSLGLGCKRRVEIYLLEFTASSPLHKNTPSEAYLRLCRAKQLSYELAFNLTSYLHVEQDYVPWAAFFDAVGFIAGMLSTSDAYGPLQVTLAPRALSTPRPTTHWVTLRVSGSFGSSFTSGSPK